MIHNASGAQMKRIIRLQNKRSARDEERVFIIEGIKLFLETPPAIIEKVYVSESFHRSGNYAYAYTGCDWELLEDGVLKKVSDTKTPQGILAVVRKPSYHLENMLSKKNPLLLFLEDIQDPGNLGTIIRSSEGAGVDGVILTSNSADIFNPKTVRSTMGSIYRVPFVYIKEINNFYNVMKVKRIKSYAACPVNSEVYYKKAYKEGTAFFIGNESRGLSPETIKIADESVNIPMLGQLESLNAAVCASLLIYEAFRQRG